MWWWEGVRNSLIFVKPNLVKDAINLPSSFAFFCSNFCFFLFSIPLIFSRNSFAFSFSTFLMWSSFIFNWLLSISICFNMFVMVFTSVALYCIVFWLFVSLTTVYLDYRSHRYKVKKVQYILELHHKVSSILKDHWLCKKCAPPQN